MNTQKAPDFSKDPHLTVEIKKFLTALNSGGSAVESMPVSEARKVLENAQKSIKVDLSGITESEKQIESDGFKLKLIIVRPTGAKGAIPAFMFIHGGGWVLGDYPTHKRLMRDLVVKSGFACVYVDYSRSPEAQFPQAPKECHAAFKWMSEHGKKIDIDPKRLAIAGNSAGGNMSVVTAMLAKENKGQMPKALVLMWPCCDDNMETDSFKAFGKQRFLTTSLMAWMFDNYCPDKKKRQDKHFSITLGTPEDYKGFPPTLIQVAENDILRDGGETLFRIMDEAGVNVTCQRYDGVIHDWGMLNGLAHIPQTAAFTDHAAAHLKNALE